MKQQILIVEDEVKIAQLEEDYLTNSGYRVKVLHQGIGVITYVKDHSPDLVILDIMLPGADGLELCREIRKFSNVPIIMVTARIEEVDRLLGLELGADDYLCKPFSPREMVARVKSVLRRVSPTVTNFQINQGPFKVNEDSMEISVNDQTLKLTPSEYELLKLLIKNPNRVFPRAELLDKVQGYEFEGYDRTIDTHIKNIRRKIAKYLPGESIIVSVYSVGYKFHI